MLALYHDTKAAQRTQDNEAVSSSLAYLEHKSKTKVMGLEFTQNTIFPHI